jgi:hypothetical protein
MSETNGIRCGLTVHAAALDIIGIEVDSINITRAFAGLEEERVLHTCRWFCNCGILFPSLRVAINARRCHLQLRKNEIARDYNTASTATFWGLYNN